MVKKLFHRKNDYTQKSEYIIFTALLVPELLAVFRKLFLE